MIKIINTLIKKHIIPKYGLNKKYYIKDLSYYPYEFNTIIIKFDLTSHELLEPIANEMIAIIKSVGLYGTNSIINQDYEGKITILFMGNYPPPS
jgi:hypothetical protein